MPIDEGAKVTTYNLLSQLCLANHTDIISINGNVSFTNKMINFNLNKMMFNLAFFQHLKKNRSQKILYIPEASITFFSFIRAKLLNLFTSKEVFILALQPRKYSFIKKTIIKFIQPKQILIQSKRSSEYLTKLGINNTKIPLGVDNYKYYEFDYTQKTTLREKHQIESKKKVLLHVGHIQKSRNLDWLIHVKEDLPEIEIIIVGSTYNQDDENIHTALLDNGIRVIREYIPNMEEIYNLADYYVFPVLKYNAGIGTPLSVLEAMSTNLPVLTTRFGSLPDTFQPDEHFKFINSPEDIVVALKEGFAGNCNNREKIQPFTWDAIADKLHEMI